ncbi:MAG: ATP-binding protein [Chloroflexota bacterium]
MRSESRKAAGKSPLTFSAAPTAIASYAPTDSGAWDRPESIDDRAPVAAIVYPEPGQIAKQIHRMAQRITSVLSLEDALSEVLRTVEILFGASGASIFLLEESGTVVNRRYTTHGTGHPHWETRPGRINPDGITMTVIHSGRPIIVEDAQQDPRTRATATSDQRTFAVIPLRSPERTSGVLYVDWPTFRYCSLADVDLLETIAAYGSVAVENARLHARELETRQRLEHFLGIVAHDLRAPLGVVTTSLEILQDHEYATRRDAIHKILPAIDHATRRMQRLIDDLLDAARVGAGRFQMRYGSMNLSALAEVVQTHRSSTKTHRITFEAPPRLEGNWDAQRIEQMFTNLLSNAIRYSPNGGTIRVRVYQDGGCAIVSVTDPGIGIAAEQVEKLFQPFFRCDPDVTVGGTGLGLYIAKAIAEAHGGGISVVSQPGKGSCFSVALPLQRPDPVFLPSDVFE